MTTTEPYDVSKMVEQLSVAFAEAEKNIPLASKLVACVHLGCAASVLKQLRIVGLVTPDQVVDYFQQAVEIALSALDPKFPTPTISFIESNGTVTRTTGKKH